MAYTRYIPPIFGASWSIKFILLLVFALACAVLNDRLLVIRSSSQMRFLAFTVASLASYSHADGAVDLSWYAPNATTINDLGQVIGGEGVYGFIYNSSFTPDEKYGTYNWCNMPHVRATAYQKPSSNYQLQYVEVIHRHHKRTVYASNSFPVESYGWDCDDEGLFFYGQPKAGKKSAHSYWQGYMSPTNPFRPSGFIGTCQFPQITLEGFEDSWKHGKELYGLYHDVLGFLPDDWEGKVTFRVTHNVITSQVAGMVINGMFNIQSAVPILVEERLASGVDSLEPTYPCAVASTLISAIESGANWTRHFTAATPLYAELDDISGVSPADPGFHASFDHYYDNLSARQCHGKPLPCKLENGINSTTCVTQAMADKVYRLGNYEYSYIFRDDPRSLAASAARYGVWIGELTTHFRDFVSGKSNVIYIHNIAHDGSLSSLLSILQLDVMVWPGMGSEVVFELYKNEETTSSKPTTSALTSPSGYYVRVLWKGQVLQSSNPSLGLMSMVPLETVLAYLDGLVGVGASFVQGKCNGTIPL